MRPSKIVLTLAICLLISTSVSCGPVIDPTPTYPKGDIYSNLKTVELDAWGDIVFVLSNSDYPDKSTYIPTTYSKVSEYDFLTKIEFVKNGVTTKLSEIVDVNNSKFYYNLSNKTKSFGIRNLNTAFCSSFLSSNNVYSPKIIIPKNTHFPSYSYTNLESDACSYVTSLDTVFNSNISFDNNIVIGQSTDISVLGIDEDLTNSSNGKQNLIFEFKNDDYVTLSNTIDFNLNQSLYSNLGDSILINGSTLSSIAESKSTTPISKISLLSNSRKLLIEIPYINQGIETIKILNGCQFPSFSTRGNDINGTSSESRRLNSLSVNQDITFTSIEGKNGFFVVKECEIESVKYLSHYLGIKSTSFNETTFGNKQTANLPYYDLSSIQIESSTLSIKENGRITYNNASIGLTGYIGIEVEGEPTDGDIFRINQGIVIPTLESDRIVYKTTSTMSLMYSNGEFEIYSVSYVNNNISGVSLHESEGTQYIDFNTEAFDWPSTVSNFDVEDSTYGNTNYSDRYNTFSKIHLINKNGDEMAKTNKLFVNLAEANNCYSICLDKTKSNIEDLDYILFDSQLELPTYAGLYNDPTNSKTRDSSRYITTKQLKLFYYQNQLIEEGKYYQTQTSILSVKEHNPYERNSLLSFALSLHDYSSIQATTNISQYSEKINELNTLDYIYINGLPLRKYSMPSVNEKYVNLYGETGTYSLRRDGNNTSCYYTENGSQTGKRVETFDLCAYEVSIIKGCQFPSMAYLSGESLVKQCYIADKNYRFDYQENAFIDESISSYSRRSIEETIITSVSFISSGTTDRAIGFTFENSDWPANSTISNYLIHSQITTKSILKNIAFVDTEDNVYSNTTDEVFANVWGSGSTSGTIAIRSPIKNIASIKEIRFYKNMFIPSYSNCINKNNYWFYLKESMTFVNNGSGVFSMKTSGGSN